MGRAIAYAAARDMSASPMRCAVALRMKTLLIGCGIGCLGVIVLSIAGCVSFTYWLTRPGELLEPERLLGADTTGYAEWTLSLDDPGTAQLVTDVLEFIQGAREGMPSPLPSSLSRVLIGYQNRRDERELRQMFPMLVAWTLHSADDGDVHLGSLSMEKLGNRMAFTDWIFARTVGWSSEADVLQHYGENIYRIDTKHGDEIAFFIHRNDLFFTSDAQNARRAVELLVVDRTAEARPPTELERLFARLPEDRPLRGAVMNESDELTRLWRDVFGAGDDVPWSAIRALTLSGGFADESWLEGRLGFLLSDAEQAERAAAALFGQLRKELAFEHVELDSEPVVEGDWVQLGLRVDLPGLLEEINPVRIRRASEPED